MTIKKANISQKFVVLDADKQASSVTFSPTVFDELNKNFNGFKGCELISVFEFDSDWSSWEIHPHGDEVVILLSGEVSFVFDMNGQHTSIQLSDSGDYVIVPKGVCATAPPSTHCKMLFITPGEGTQNKDC